VGAMWPFVKLLLTTCYYSYYYNKDDSFERYVLIHWRDLVCPFVKWDFDCSNFSHWL